jgi:DNA-binding NarL/FixJ family response regulator
MARIMTGPKRLSARQLQVAQLVTKGLTNEQIATQLGIAKRTVDAHLQNIYAKTGANSRTRLTNWLLDRF